MGGTNPFSNLFPDLSNLNSNDSTSGSGQEHEVDPDPSDWSQIDDDRESADALLLQQILTEIKEHDITAYKSRLGEQKFYLSEQLEKRVPASLLGDSLGAGLQGDAADFHSYNKKVEREYILRKKMESLIQNKGTQLLAVLDSNALEENFLAGKEVPTKISKPTRARLRLKNFVTTAANKSPSAPQDELCKTHTSDTQVIDLEKDHNGALDENHFSRQYEHNPSISSLEGFSTRSSLFNGRRLLRIFQDDEKNSVQRKLRTRHIQMIATGAAMGVGLFLNSGKALSIGGPFGFLLGFSICGSIVLATMLSFTEIATLIPLSSGISGLASRFVEDAFGFALGWSYWLTYAITLANQIVASNFMLSYYGTMPARTGSTVGFVTFFLVFAIAGNLLDVNILAELAYGFTFFKIVITATMIFAMVILNAGAGRHKHPRVGFRFWDASKSPENLTYGLFRPTFDLQDVGDGAKNGIPGAKGRFLSVLVVIIVSSFSFSGVEVGFVACGEAANPRRSLPSATKRTIMTVIILYVVSIFVISLNVYSGDSRLLRYYTAATQEPTQSSVRAFNNNWQTDQVCTAHEIVSTTDFTNGSQSPWVLALESFGLCTFSSVFNAMLVIFGVTSELSSLYASSRTLYSMSIQGKAPPIFKICSRKGVPYVAVIFSGLFGALAYLTVNAKALEIFQALANISGATISIIWFGFNLSFLRFYYALKRRPDIISREDPSFPYRSPLQPFLACYGLFGSFLIVVLMGFSNFLDGFWNTKMFFSSYGGLIVFILCYAGYRLLGTSKIQRLDQLDLDSGRREMDRMIWTEHREYTNSVRERIRKLVTWMF